MSFIREAVEFILAQAQQNGVVITDEIRGEAYELVKLGLYNVGWATHGILIDNYRRPVTNEITTYEGGCFGLYHCAPGGLKEFHNGVPVEDEVGLS